LTEKTASSLLKWRYFSYQPGSGSPRELPALESPGEEGQPNLLAYLDERTAIWRTGKTGIWMTLLDGKPRKLWPL
jgi:hypothetical protein